jgi:hypothetical protein
MNLRSRKTLAVGAAVLVVGAAAGAAFATTSRSSAKAAKGDQPFLVGVASRIHVDPNALLAALKAEATARIDAAVVAGNLPAKAAAELKARIAAATLERPLGFGGQPFRRGAGAVRPIVQAAADYIGISVGDVRAAVFSGKSLAQLATEHGKSVDGLKQAILDAVKARLDRTQLSSERKQRILDRLEARLDRLVNRSFPSR